MRACVYCLVLEILFTFCTTLVCHCLLSMNEEELETIMKFICQ